MSAPSSQTPAPPTSIGWFQVSSALERALREKVAARIGRGRLTNRVAHLLAQAMLLEGASSVLEHEARSLGDDGPSTMQGRTLGFVREMRDEVTTLRRHAAQLEAEQVEAGDAERYVELRMSILGIEAPDAMPDVVNELIQAQNKLGERALLALWDHLETDAERRELVVTVDLRERFERALEGFEAPVRTGSGEASASAPAVDLTPPRLLRATDELYEEAGGLDKETLFDRIEAIAGRLKALQESARLDESDAKIVRKAFGTLTRLSKRWQPGFTKLLDSKRTGENWMGYAEAADARLAQRAKARAKEREVEREQLRRDAVERMRRHSRRIVFLEAVERLKRNVYLLSRVWAVDGAEEMAAKYRRYTRTQAAIALQAMESEEDLAMVAEPLEERRELVREGRALKPLRRYWGMEEVERDTGPEEAEVDEDLDEPDLEEAVQEIEQPWNEEVLEARGVGQGERVLIVGGLPNRQREEVLRDFFGWDHLDWQESYRDHQADFKTLRKRIADGRFDRVIVLARFCGHDVHFGLREACRGNGVGYHVHPRGVSVPAIALSVYGA